MEVIIYGAPGCVNCDKTKMLCQIQSLAFQYLVVGQDVSQDELQAKVGQEVSVRSLPQIFVRNDSNDIYIGGYDALRSYLRQPQPTTATAPDAALA